VPDPIAPPVASRPAEAVELVSLAVSDGDLDAAVAQYEAGAVLRPWARDLGGDKDGVADALIQLMGLRLPLSVGIRTIVRTSASVIVAAAPAARWARARPLLLRAVAAYLVR
jgi:hypothetical protein